METTVDASKVESLVTKTDELLSKTDKLLASIEVKQKGFEGEIKDIKDAYQKFEDGDSVVSREELEKALDGALEKQRQENIASGYLSITQRESLAIADPWDACQKGYYFDYNVDPAECIKSGYEGLNKLITLPGIDDAHKSFSRMGGDVQIMDKVGRTICKQQGLSYPGLAAQWPKTSKKWAWYVDRYIQHVGVEKVAGDAIDTIDAANWVPTGWASEMNELIMIGLVVPALFRRFPMPTQKFDLPVNLTDVVGNYVPETTDITDPYATTGAAGQIQALNDAKATFEARKLRARMMISGEMIEDAMVAMLPLIRDQITKILRNAQEKGLIDGQEAAGIDSDYTAGLFDVREAFDGLRKFADLATSYVDFSGSLSTSNLVGSMRLEMGEYAAELGNLAYIFGIAGSLKVLTLAEVLTVDKLGPNATVLTGQVGAIGGVPIVVSRYVREDLANNGKYDGVTTDKTVVILARTDAFLIGDRRNVTVESERIIQTDQVDTVAMQRMDFQNLFGSTYKTAAVGHNIAST